MLPKRDNTSLLSIVPDLSMDCPLPEGLWLEGGGWGWVYDVRDSCSESNLKDTLSFELHFATPGCGCVEGGALLGDADFGGCLDGGFCGAIPKSLGGLFLRIWSTPSSRTYRQFGLWIIASLLRIWTLNFADVHSSWRPRGGSNCRRFLIGRFWGWGTWLVGGFGLSYAHLIGRFSGWVVHSSDWLPVLRWTSSWKTLLPDLL